MNIRRAGRKVVKNLHKGYGIYRIGFVNIYGEEDETELDAMNINDLERLWLSLCPEFECKGNSLLAVTFCGMPHFNDYFLCRQKFNDYICMT